MKIRKAIKKDLKEIAQLMINEFSKPPFNEKAPTKAVLKSLMFYHKNAEIFIVKIKKEIVGLIVFRTEQWWEGKVIILQNLAVEEKFKRQGLGKNLMKFLESHAKRKNVKKIYFETNEKSSAFKFYKKIGYKTDKNWISMSKKLK